MRQAVRLSKNAAKRLARGQLKSESSLQPRSLRGRKRPSVPSTGGSDFERGCRVTTTVSAASGWGSDNWGSGEVQRFNADGTHNGIPIAVVNPDQLTVYSAGASVTIDMGKSPPEVQDGTCQTFEDPEE